MREMSADLELPTWLQGRDYTVWHRHNLWMLFNALAMNAHSLTLVALWDARAWRRFRRHARSRESGDVAG